MSLEIELKVNDYRNIMGWFELAFAKNNEIKEKDNETFRKISVMAMCYLEEKKEQEDSTNEKG
jgi:hypothetical protein|tara:strand:- start:1666 stop:1854 length:189 start_codon:yes stop_codon:yes gene_type:complete